MVITGATSVVAQQQLSHQCAISLSKLSVHIEEQCAPLNQESTTLIPSLTRQQPNLDSLEHKTVSYINSGKSANRHESAGNEASMREDMNDALHSILDYLAPKGFDKKDKKKNEKSNIFAYILYDNTPKCRLRGSKTKSSEDSLPQSFTSLYNSYDTHYSLGYHIQKHSRMERYGYVCRNSYINCLTTTSIDFTPTGDSQQQLLVQYAHAGRNSQDRESNKH